MRIFDTHSLWQALTRRRVFHVNVTLRARLVALILGLILLSLAVLTLSTGATQLTNLRGAPDAMTLASSAAPGPGLERYVDPERGFFFDYPDTLSLSETEDAEYHYIFGETGDGETHLMIVICPYAEHEPPTEDLVRAQPSAPDITSPIDRTTLPSGTTAFLFRRVNTPMGVTRDAFFVHNQTAYQVSVVADSEEVSNEILTTWLFASPASL